MSVSSNNDLKGRMSNVFKYRGISSLPSLPYNKKQQGHEISNVSYCPLRKICSISKQFCGVSSIQPKHSEKTNSPQIDVVCFLNYLCTLSITPDLEKSLLQRLSKVRARFVKTSHMKHLFFKGRCQVHTLYHQSDSKFE